ncbi:hypothetical protein NPJ82_17810 (plasmid) [Sphingomonas sp. NY01]|uniref:hypothetical protein n=1 Tax=Sphingomonas sp. NY01 TaxID=2968057 RepID=UPI00315C6B69
MAAWHRSRRADIVLRATGLLLCWVSYTAFLRLVAMHVPPQKAGILAYGIAAVGFMAASAGSALIFLGYHFFDEIEVSARWRERPATSVLFPSESYMKMDMPEPVILVVGHDIGGRTSNSVATSAGSPRRIEGRLSLVCGRTLKGSMARG